MFSNSFIDDIITGKASDVKDYIGEASNDINPDAISYSSFLEGAMDILVEMEESYHNIIVEENIEQLDFFDENGTMVLYESEDKVSKFFDRIRAWFITLGQNTVKYFKQFITYMENIVSSNKKFLEKYKEVPNKIKTVKMNNFIYIKNLDIIDKYAEAMKSYISSIFSKGDIAKDKAEAEIKKFEEIDNFRGQLYAKCVKESNAIDSTKFIDKTKEIIYIKSDKFDADVKAAFNGISNIKSTKDGASKSFDRLKKEINISIDELNKQKKSIDRKSEDKNVFIKHAKYHINAYQNMSKILTTTNGIIFDAIRRRYNQDKSVFMKAVMEFKSVKNESTDVNTFLSGYKLV